jgi:hypothetical protein
MGVRTQAMFVALRSRTGGIVFSFVQLAHDERPSLVRAIAFSAVLVQGVLGGLG